MPKDTQKAARRSARGSSTSQSSSVSNSQSGPTTRSRALSAVNSQPRPPNSRAPNRPRNKFSRSATGHPASRDESSANNEDSVDSPAHNAIPAAVPNSLYNGAFNNARNVILNQPMFVEGVHPKEKDYLLIQNIIPGAQFDSGERYPPPSCHPGTRLDISETIVSWMRDLMRKHKIVWLHGPAGVGKSAVIQTLAEAEANSETSILGATLFFSKPNERDDPQRVFITIAYQLAVKYPTYRAYVVERLVVDPLLVRKSMVEQFKWLIVKPLAEKRSLEGIHDTVLITLDGLDECNGEWAQREIILLISKFCLEQPANPLIWIIVSRPEPEICTAFSHSDVQGAYVGIDMPVDAGQACRDVEHYLRGRFTEIKEKYSTSFSSTQQWPTETDFAKIARRSSGLFAFANTVTRFTGDTEYANPVAQLQKVLDILESPSSPAEGDSPFAALDMIYTLILSAISPKVWPITRNLLSLKFLILAEACNMLSINQAGAYGALRKLHSVLRIPGPQDAFKSKVEVFHKSFDDFLRSPSRSGLFWLNTQDRESVIINAPVRILLEAHDAAKFLVHPSSINISWTDGGSIKNQQDFFFRKSLGWVLRASLDKIKGFDELRYFFQDIDYGSSEIIDLFTDVRDFVRDMFISPLMSGLEEWGVITTVPTQSLNFDSLDKPIYLLRSTTGSNADYALDTGQSIAKVIFPPHSWALEANEWDVIKGHPDSRSEPHREDQYHLHLTGLPPTNFATVMGKGNKRLVFIGVDDPKESWIYILRYKRS